MQLVALKYFVAVADHGSFTAAAEWLGASASTLTRSISTLVSASGALSAMDLYTAVRGGGDVRDPVTTGTLGQVHGGQSMVATPAR